MSRFNEPWFAWTGICRVLVFDRTQVEDGNGNNRPVAIVDANDYDSMADAEFVAARIVACVNAMEGVGDPAAFAAMGRQVIDPADYIGR